MHPVRKPLRPVGRRRPGVRVDGDRRWPGPGYRQGRIMGRQRLRGVPAGGPALPAAAPQAHPDRVPPGAGGLAH